MTVIPIIKNCGVQANSAKVLEIARVSGHNYNKKRKTMSMGSMYANLILNV